MDDGDVKVENNLEFPWKESQALNVAEHTKRYSEKTISAVDYTKTKVLLNFQRLFASRDEAWREHEQSQFSFVQKGHQRMLMALYHEIEQLQRKCNKLTLELARLLNSKNEFSNAERKQVIDDQQSIQMSIENLNVELRNATDQLMSMRNKSAIQDQEIATIERRLVDQENRYRENLETTNKDLRIVTSEMNQKSAVIVQMMTQMHQLRLREAVEKQKQHQIDQQSKRRQMLLKTFGNKPVDTWLQRESTDASNPTIDLNVQMQIGKPRSRFITTPSIIRSSILPQIMAPNVAATASMVMNSIEKPIISSIRKSLRRNKNQGYDLRTD